MKIKQTFYTCGMTPISSKRGPRMNPPPDPKRPPTVPPNIPQNAQNVRCGAVQSIAASHTDSGFPMLFLFLLSLFSLTHSYPNTASATGNCRRHKQTYKLCQVIQYHQVMHIKNTRAGDFNPFWVVFYLRRVISSSNGSGKVLFLDQVYELT